MLRAGRAPRILSVSELAQLLRGALDAGVGTVWVAGEISNLKRPASGHLYFTLKDDRTQLGAVMFRSAAQVLVFQPVDGMDVVVRARADLYPARGALQLYVEAMEPRGLGALTLAFEQLKVRLGAEGLFADARKRPLPRWPRAVGIVTALHGAAIHDMRTVLARRWPTAAVVVRPVRVQGRGAAREIAAGIEDLNRLADVDVVIIGRGGGSLEDLWAFNEEVVARAIAASTVPVVSAVGHEVDITIADFVADLRAPTPSVAAELVVREKRAVVDALDALRERLERAATRPLRDAERRVDELSLRLRRAMTGELRHASHRVEMLTSTLRSTSPVARVANGRHRLERLDARLASAFTQSCDRSRFRLRALVAKLDSLSPLAVLGRGYSLTRAPDGAIVRSARQVKVGDDVQVLLHEGSLDCRVARTKDQDDRPQV